CLLLHLHLYSDIPVCKPCSYFHYLIFLLKVPYSFLPSFSVMRDISLLSILWDTPILSSLTHSEIYLSCIQGVRNIISCSILHDLRHYYGFFLLLTINLFRPVFFIGDSSTVRETSQGKTIIFPLLSA